MTRSFHEIESPPDPGRFTLANPEIVDDIRHHVHSARLARGDTPRELSPQEAQGIQAFGKAE
jgi:acetyl-CoA synthetase